MGLRDNGDGTITYEAGPPFVNWRLRAEAAEAECARLKRAADVYRSERDQARAQADRAVQILIAIHGSLNPAVLTLPNGQSARFVNPMANETLQMLSDRIRAIPDELAAMASAPSSGRADQDGDAEPQRRPREG